MNVRVLAWGAVLAFAAHSHGAVPSVAPGTVSEFDLSQVRLLPSPFLEAQKLDEHYLLSLQPDRLLLMFRVTAGISSHVAPYGGWESPGWRFRGHTTGHYLTACSLMYAATGDRRFKARVDQVVAGLAECQANLPAQGYHPGYLSAFPESFFNRVEEQKPMSGVTPWYVMHKIMTGLYDAHVRTGNTQALEVLKKLAAWAKGRVDRLSYDQMQFVLEKEQGGMSELLAHLYALTGEPDYLRLAQVFNHQAVFRPLARDEDRLDGLHANTQIPKIIGAAVEYELTGKEEYRDVAQNFWRDVALNRSYAFGGDSDNERFFPIAQFPVHLSGWAAETCNTYNMLKLTEHIFAWTPTAEVMNFYERALYNDILASQDPQTGMLTYFMSAKPGLFKTYSTPENSFWCCVGTGMENHAKYGQMIFSHSADSLYLNLFVASELNWSERGIVVRQETDFPDKNATHLLMRLEKSQVFALWVRQPDWCRTAIGITVNGAPAHASEDGSGYLKLDRQWSDGDRVDITLPMSLRSEALPGDSKRIALFYGPILLAGALGTEGIPPDGQYATYEKQYTGWPTPPEPLLNGSPAQILDTLTSIPGENLTFRTHGIGAGQDYTLIPFFRLHHQRYTVYWETKPPSRP